MGPFATPLATCEVRLSCSEIFFSLMPPDQSGQDLVCEENSWMRVMQARAIGLVLVSIRRSPSQIGETQAGGLQAHKTGGSPIYSRSIKREETHS